ncbi:laminin B domain-containing protein [Spirosoma spitsbergense]|uniref:laminin B domain-containing protein n=1 Tax=Spirosoma spitsbergense TaxID=431554 RepID=UPI001FE073EE|nr:laminin B domain-containing protein [Spirosoma spitsbergense]
MPFLKSSAFNVLVLLICGTHFTACTELITPLFPISYGFDDDAQGWEGSVGCKSGYSATGGNPGGYVYGIDDATGFWYFVASTEFTTTVRKAYGLQLSFDLEQSAIDNQADADDIIITDGTLTLTHKTSYNPKTIWTAYSVKLDETAGWKKGKVKATKAELQQVLQNLTSLKIRGEFRSGPDRGGLDNVSIR